MDPTDAIIGSVVVIGGTTIVRVWSKGNQAKPLTTVRVITFSFLLAIVLLVIAIGAPGFAKGLALLGLVGAFAANGPALFELIGKVG